MEACVYIQTHLLFYYIYGSAVRNKLTTVTGKETLVLKISSEIFNKINLVKTQYLTSNHLSITFGDNLRPGFVSSLQT